MLVKTEAIVLHSLKYGESKLIVDLFTRESGRLSCIVGIPKTGRGRLKKQYFQPLSLLDVECDIRPNVQLQKLRDARLLHPFSTLTVEPVKISISLFLAEFLYHALRGEQQPDTGMFDYMKHSLLWLDEAKTGYANFHLAFLIHLSRFLGVGLLRSMTQEGEGLFFDLREGEYCDVPPLHQEFLRPEEASRIKNMLRMDYQNMHLFRLSHTERNRCLDVILAYYRLHLPAFPELKSLPVLQALFA